MLQRVDRIMLRVGALKPAVRFYCEVMGLSAVREDARLALLRMPGSDTELILHCDPDLPAEAVYYLVDDVRALHARREELGIQFTQAPAAVSRGYRAAIRDPFGNVLLIVDRSLQAGSAPGPIEDARPAAGLFPGVEPQATIDRELLMSSYVRIGRVADDLPYTPDFERLYALCTAGLKPPAPTREQLWRTLLTIRKAGKLPKLGQARSRPPAATDEEKAWWRQKLGEEMGRRDRLPYSEKFDQLVDEFNRQRARAMSPHLVWRLVATLAK